MKLIVLSLLLGGIANANGGTCKAKKLREGFEDLQSQGGEILDEVADIKAEVADLKAQVAEIKSLVEFIASEATEKPTAEPTPAPTAPPTVALNGCGEPCLGVETLNTVPFHIESGTCYVVEGTFLAALIVPEGVECAKITVPKGSGLFEIRAHSRVFLFAPRPTKR